MLSIPLIDSPQNVAPPTPEHKPPPGFNQNWCSELIFCDSCHKLKHSKKTQQCRQECTFFIFFMPKWPFKKKVKRAFWQFVDLFEAKCEYHRNPIMPVWQIIRPRFWAQISLHLAEKSLQREKLQRSKNPSSNSNYLNFAILTIIIFWTHAFSKPFDIAPLLLAKMT